MLHPIVTQEGVRPSPEQEPAVTTRGRDVVVTAGAGAGKTRTLVARYLSLLAEGMPLRAIVAITFTRKAAREMRNRVRAAIRTYLEGTLAPAERERWNGLYSELDAARIGTIHQLCTEILRAHPAGAGVDPRFAVLDEAQAALLRAQAVDDALAWAADDGGAVILFPLLGERTLQDVLATLLARRLEATTAFATRPGDVLAYWEEVLQAERQQALAHLLADDAWQQHVATLRANEPLLPDDRMAVQRAHVLAALADAATADPAGAKIDALAAIDDVNLSGGSQKAWPGDKAQKDEVKDALRGLRTLWRERAGRLTLALNEQDEALAAALPALKATFTRACTVYDRLKAEQQALDFDDLEHEALALLQNEAIRHLWQTEVRAILVDEYQDTNARQRDLVNALNGAGGKLFIVGDAKQSIYRFRGADVTVFRRERERIDEEGAAVRLATSYRAHRNLIADLNALLEPVLGEADPAQPWREPFASLRHVRDAPRPGVTAPHVQLHLTVGSKGDGALARAATALAGTLRAWAEDDGVDLTFGDVAVLCRASTSFGAYEDAFDAVGIPYLTVAGRGFYERPEIRDLLNALRALSDPGDDLALAGLLRSPVFAFSDADLYDLRPEDETTSWWDALRAAEGERAAWAAATIATLHARTGRLPVADVLKAFLDETNYRAALHMAGQERAARNVDKLLADAHTSGIVGVGAFLEYVENLRAGGAREGEAQATAEGAVRIMSVHAAKGLEFPVVVIGDINYGGGRQGSPLLLDEEWGVLLNLKDEEDEVPAIYELARVREGLQEAAESERLLYVAATRAEEMLILNGCIGLTRSNRPGWLRGWLKQLAPHLGLDDVEIDYDEEGARALSLDLAVGDRPVAGVVYEPGAEVETTGDPAGARPEPVPEAGWAPDLLRSLLPEEEEDPAGTPQRVWRIVPETKRPQAPAWVIGSLVHEALAAWRFPDGDFEQWAEARARSYGLTDRQQLRHAARRTAWLLRRFHKHPLRTEIEGAEQHLHEVPYSLQRDGRPEQGTIDLLYRRDGGWTVVDFKTDRIQGEAELASVLGQKKYGAQLERYVQAVAQLLGQRPRALLCLLDYDGGMRIMGEDELSLPVATEED